MKKHLFRLLTLLCVFAFIVTAMPVTVSAEELTAAFTNMDSNISTEADSSKTFEEAAIIGEITDMREESVKYFRRDDGMIIAAMYDKAVHYQDGDEWKEIDNTLVAEETRDGVTYYKNTANKLQVRMPDQLNTNTPITVQNGEYTLQWTLQSGQSKSTQITPVHTSQKKTTTLTTTSSNTAVVKNQKELNEQKMTVEKLGSSVVYDRVYDNVLFHYDVVGDKFKESIVLAKPTNQTEFSFLIQAQGLTAQLQEDGSVRFFASGDDKEPVFVIASPYMFDSNHEYSQDVTVQLTSVKGGYRYVLTPSQTWLQAEERQYPVTIDPTVMPGYDELSIQTTEIYSGAPDTNYSTRPLAYVGSYSSNSNIYECQTLMKIPLTGNMLAANEHLVSATLYLCKNTQSNPQEDCTLVRAYAVKTNWNESTVTWDTRPEIEPSTIDYAMIDFAPNGGELDPSVDQDSDPNSAVTTFDITSIVLKWMSGTRNNGLLFKTYGTKTYNDHVSWITENAQIDGTEPTVVLSFRDVSGIESYWTYSSTSVGRGATVAVNNATGAVTAVIPDCGVDGNRMPVSISHVYNTFNTLDTTYGGKWRLNYQMKLEPVTLKYHTINSVDQSVVENTEQTYRFTDGDGTAHYFVRTSTDTYKDEDGLGLTLTIDNNSTTERYTITDKDKNMMVFNNHGNLKFIRDTNCNSTGESAPNYIEIFYDTDSATQKITRIRDGAERVYTLSYYDGHLVSITDPAGRATRYNYDNDTLVKVTYPDAVETTLAYSSGHLSAVSGLGQTIDILYDASQKRVSYLTLHSGSTGLVGDNYYFEYGHNYTDVTIVTGAKFTYQFNEYLQTVCVVSHEDGRAQSYKYGKPGGTELSGEENHLLLASDAKQSTGNLLYNGRLDQAFTSTSGHFFPSISSGISGEVTYDSTCGHTANGSIRVERIAATTDPLQYIYAEQQVVVPETGYYTLSAFVNTNGATLLDGYGAVVRLERWLNYSEHLSSSQYAVSYTPANEWRRAGTTLYCEEGDILKVLVGTYGNETLGEMWFDDVQLEMLSETVNEFNLLEDSDFNRELDKWENSSNPWIENTIPATIAGVTVSPVAAIASTTGEGYIKQTILVTNGQKGDAYSMGTWAKGASAPLTGHKNRTYGVRLDFKNTDGTVTTRRISCNSAYADWQFVSGEAIADKEYTEVTLYLEYGYNVNTVEFARPFLYKDNYGQSYSYDDNGNVISAADQTQNATTYAYNNNQLNQLASPTGSVQMMSTDPDTNYLESVMTTNGQRYEYEYDEFGNMEMSRVGSEYFDSILRNGDTFVLRNAATGNAFDCEGLAADKIYRNWRWTKDSETQPITLVATSEPGVYVMYPAGQTGLCVDVEGGSSADDARIQLWSDNNGDPQKFKIEPNDNGTYTILTKISNYTKCIDGQPGDELNGSNGAEISQQTVSLDENGNVDDPGQQWYFIHYKEEVTDDYHIQSSADYTEDGNYLAAATDALGNVTTYTTDANTGNTTAVVAPDGTETTYGYDYYGLHNTSVSVYKEGGKSATVQYTYNQDRLTSVFVSFLQRYSFSYDPLGRTSAVRVGGSTTTPLATYSYNLNNLLSRLTYGNGQRVNYLYDGLGRQTKMWYNDAENSGVETVYNDRGLTGLLKDHITNTRTRYEYDLAGRLVHLRRTNGSTADSDSRIGELFYFYENTTNQLSQTRVLLPFYSSTYNYTYGSMSDGEIPDNLYSLSHNGTTEIEYTYDDLGRLDSRKLSVPNLTTNYIYTNISALNRTSGQVKMITTPTESIMYNYDAMGNIVEVHKNNVLTESYTYDNLGQMTAATVNGTSRLYTYDVRGNILSVNGGGSYKSYTYGNSVWKDQLTAYNGQEITYDAIGNPLTYRDGMSFTWQNGRQLASATKGSTTTTYTYNADGGRNTKTVGDKTYKYYYVGGVLYAMTVGNYTLIFFYDDTGRPYSFVLNIDTGSSILSYTLYYKYNLQGDVVSIFGSSGAEAVAYTYDPWGKLLSTTGPMTVVLGGLNPFLYRGYIYDYDTGLYYCNSRYYDPETGRWINADGLVSTGQGVLGYNMYAYCNNNPIIYSDVNGCYCTRDTHTTSLNHSLSDLDGDDALRAYVTGSSYRNVEMSAGTPNQEEMNPIDKWKEKGVEFEPDEKGNGGRIKNSYLIDSAYDRTAYVMYLMYESDYKSNFSGSIEGFVFEWDVHNIAYHYYVNKNDMVSADKAKHLDVGRTIYADTGHGVSGYMMLRLYELLYPNQALDDYMKHCSLIKQQ